MGAGNDVVNSGAGQDFVSTDDMNVTNGTITALTNSGVNAAGDDRINLEAGNDFVAVGSNLQATDTIDGGTGTDHVVFEGNYATTPLVLVESTLTNVEYFIMSNGFDYDITLHDNTFTETNYNAVIQGQGLGASDVLTINASAETTTNITINGGAAADTLIGGAGNDTINGGFGGDDTLTGGDGNDLFQFLQLSGNDTITDFSRGNDKIILNSDAQFSGLGVAVSASEFISGAGISNGNAGDFLIYDTDGGALYYDANADGADAVQIATLTGSPDINNTDFVMAGLS
jgi:Ca2+-binding RTX toxin-like protein